MRANQILMLLPAFFFLLPTGKQPQMPPQPAKLSIFSQPAGAVVTINGRQMQQRTNATFVVSPGTYQVAVENSNPPLHCPARAVTLTAGETLAVTCTSNGWK